MIKELFHSHITVNMNRDSPIIQEVSDVYTFQLLDADELKVALRAYKN